MNTQLLKAKMATFFDQVSPDYLIQEFEQMGYQFTDIETPVEWPCTHNYYTVELISPPPSRWIGRLWSRIRKESAKKMTSEFPGSFFLLNLVR